jgi:hypothetical protein
VPENCVDEYFLKQRTLAFSHRGQPYREGMPSDRSSLQSLKNLISEIDLIVSTTDPLPENRTPRCRELLRAALALTDDLLSQTKLTPAAIMGQENLRAGYCVHFAYYNFCRIHKTRRGTRTMESDLTDHVWELAELLG